MTVFLYKGLPDMLKFSLIILILNNDIEVVFGNKDRFSTK